MSRCVGAGLSIFVGLPILHAASGQRDLHTQVFLPTSSLSVKDEPERTENCKLPEKRESGEVSA